MEPDQEIVEDSSSDFVLVNLTEADIPGASLEEPLESQNVAALRWWLLCHGISVSSSTRKAQLITKYYITAYV